MKRLSRVVLGVVLGLVAMGPAGAQTARAATRGTWWPLPASYAANASVKLDGAPATVIRSQDPDANDKVRVWLQLVPTVTIGYHTYQVTTAPATPGGTLPAPGPNSPAPGGGAPGARPNGPAPGASAAPTEGWVLVLPSVVRIGHLPAPSGASDQSGGVAVQLTEPLPPGLRLAGATPVPAVGQPAAQPVLFTDVEAAPDGSGTYLVTAEKPLEDSRQYTLSVRDTTLSLEFTLDPAPRLRSMKPWPAVLGATCWWLALSVIIWGVGLFRRLPSTATTTARVPALLRPLAEALVEPDTQTYSLSRFQLLWWSAILAWVFLFLVVARWLIDGVIGWPAIDALPWPFLISLTTFVGAQAASKSIGPQGAGGDGPSLADLVCHGGVFAMERAQQFGWTLVAGVMFLCVAYHTVSTYGPTHAVPDIPQQMLWLMGLSAAGYVGGKVVRKPGPILKQVTPMRLAGGEAGLCLSGLNLSPTPGVQVVLQSNPPTTLQVTRACVPTGTQDTDFVTELWVSVKDVDPTRYAAGQTVRVINADGQYADYKLTAPPA